MRENEGEKLRDFRANLHIRVRDGAVDTRKASGRNRAFCGAPWHRSISKRGHFFS